MFDSGQTIFSWPALCLNFMAGMGRQKPPLQAAAAPQLGLLMLGARSYLCMCVCSACGLFSTGSRPRRRGRCSRPTLCDTASACALPEWCLWTYTV